MRVLVSLGWMALGWTDRECQLEKGVLAITVPLDAKLSSEAVAAIVEVAGEPPWAFVAGLERIRTQQVTAPVSDDESSRKTA